MSTRIPNLSRAPLLTMLIPLAITAGWSVPVTGQETVTLEEVMVTARKREESLQDVPISINAVGAAKLEEAGIKKLEDLQALVPNFQLTETGISTQMYIRGIGTSNNQGFEQSVGQYIDGIYYGRQQLIRAPMFDLERVEVLRGPQGILFGKNSIAGALNLTTAKPTDERMGKVAVTLNPAFGGHETRFVFSQGITDTLAGRIAMRFFEEDGYVRNSLRNDDEVNRREQTVRGSLRWYPTDAMEWNLKAEWSEFNQTGRQIETIQDDPALSGTFINRNYAQILGFATAPGGITEIRTDYTRQADALEKSDNVLRNFTLTGVYNFNSGHVLTSTTAYVEYAFDEICDCDFVGASVFDLPMSEGYEQISQELRIASPGGEFFDWQGGLFFQNNDVVFEDMLRVVNTSLLPLPAAPAPPPNGFGLPLQELANQGAARVYESDSELYAAFLEGTFTFTDSLRVTIGGRYTKEDKSGSRVGNVIQLDPATNERMGISANAGAAFLFTLLFGFDNEQNTGHNLSGARSESSFTPSVSVQLDLNDDWMAYATASTGFKSGGYDARGNNINSFEFEQEDARAVELGAKGKFLDGRLEANVAVYHTDYDDLQVSQFDGQIGFNVGNAGKVRARGVEMDGRWAISEGLTSTFSVAYLDHEYTDFKNGNCYNRQVPNGIVVDGIQLCDYTGLSGQYTPEITGSTSLDYYKQLRGNFDLRVTGDVSWSGRQNVHVNLDPQYVIKSYAKYNMRVALESDNWTLALSGLNLTDETILTYVGNHPLSGSTFGTNTFYGFVAPPRTFTVSATYEF
ncbi:MAG: TonB-dependent receptor [Gammaproteobacteria bacterium]|nr:TonB-dependent receptor [Gammaproteobacteria bacterium]